MRRQYHGRTKKNRVCFYLPENLDVKSALPAELRRYADCAAYIVHLIVRGRVLREADEAGYVPIKVAYLRKAVPWRVERAIRMALVRSGVILCDPSYIIGEHSMSYRLTDYYQTPAKMVRCGDARLATKVSAIRRTEFWTDIKLPVHKHLHSWLRQLEIDGDAARATVLSTPRLAEHADIHLTAISMIDSGHVEFSHCRNGRVHTLITRIAKELRPHLRINNQTLVNIDIANSQPLILAHLTTHPIHTPTPTQLNHPQPIPSTNTMLALGENFMYSVDANGLRENGNAHGDDVKKYVVLCESGEVYDYLTERAGLVGMSRQQVKEKFYTEIFFGRNQVVTDFTRLFAREFPNVMQVIRNAKREDYRELACTMQRLESDLIIHGVCRRLASEHPDIPLLTIHDSLMVPAESVDIVRGVMLDEFAKVGLRPTLRVEDYGSIEPAAKAA